jgi:hypothetical protein
MGLSSVAGWGAFLQRAAKKNDFLVNPSELDPNPTSCGTLSSTHTFAEGVRLSALDYKKLIIHPISKQAIAMLWFVSLFCFPDSALMAIYLLI